MGERFLYLTTIGRTTGLPRTIEIWFVEREGRHYIVAENRDATGWVKNVRKNPSVRFQVGTREAREEVVPSTAAHARVVDDDEAPELAKAVRALMDAKYRWSAGLVVEIAPD